MPEHQAATKTAPAAEADWMARHVSTCGYQRAECGPKIPPSLAWEPLQRASFDV